MKISSYINTKSLKIIICTAIAAVLFIPYIQTEFYTQNHGASFAKRYEQIGMSLENCRYKVMEYNGNKATVYYVPEDKSCGVVIRFRYSSAGVWSYSGWDCIWSTSGSADDIIWPYYPYWLLHEAGA